MRRLQTPHNWSGSATDLIGLHIYRIWVEDGERSLHLDTNHGLVSIVTDGDCCSQTWFADILGVDAAIGERVEGVSEPAVPHVNDGRCRQEVDRFYCIELRTKKGRCQIVYRCSSNGYYGGSSSVSRNPSSPDVPTPIPGHWRKISDDWSA